MNVIIRDLDKIRIHFEAAITRVGEDTATRAFTRAINREGDKIRTKVRRELRIQTGAKTALINRETRSIKASFSNLTYTIEARGDFLGLSHFAPSQFKYGVRAKPWGRFQRFPGAFLVGGLGNNAFVRETAARFPIKKMFGPSIPREMLKDATARAFQDAQPDVLTEATRQIQRIIDGT